MSRLWTLFYWPKDWTSCFCAKNIDTWISTHWFELATNRPTPSTLKSQTGACSMCYFSASHGKSSPTVLRSHGYYYKRCRIFLHSGRLDRSTLTPRRIYVNALILKTSSTPPPILLHHIFFYKQMLKCFTQHNLLAQRCFHVIQSSTPTIGQRYMCLPTLT